MSSMDFHETWTLTLVQQRHDPTPIDVPVPETLEELRQSLGVDSGVPLLVSHRLHPDQHSSRNGLITSTMVPQCTSTSPGDAFAVDDRHLFNGCLLTGCLRWIFFGVSFQWLVWTRIVTCPVLCALKFARFCVRFHVCVPCKLDPAVV